MQQIVPYATPLLLFQYHVPCMDIDQIPDADLM